MQKSRLKQEEKREVEKDNPALSKVIERNIRTIIHLRSQAARERSLQGRISDAIQDKLSIVDHENSELADLEMETKPEDVLAEIQRLQAIELAERKAL